MHDRREFLKNLSIGAAGIAVFPRLAFGQADPWKTEYPKILARIKPPTFKKKDYNILKFGAQAGGEFDCRDAINKAIGACSKAGGGRVVVPAGEYLTGAIRLKSNVNLHVSKGATLKFATDAKAYLPIVHTRWEGMELMHLSPLIYAYEEMNVAITGEGTLDGQGKAYFWKWHGNSRFGGNPDELTSFVVLPDYRTGATRMLRKSSAALFVARELGWPWKAALVLRILPALVLDRVYDVVARTRYRVFGRLDQCLIPGPEFRRRFIDS